MKQCKKCNEVKDLELFKKDSRNSDGRGAWCKPCHTLDCLRWQKENKEQFQEYQKIYKTLPKEKLRRRTWRKANLDLHNKDQKDLTLKKKLATPKWLSKQQREEMEEFYVLAKELSWLSEDILVVDHIMPIRGKHSCGLHVPWNLQIIPNKINCAKGNDTEGWVGQ